MGTPTKAFHQIHYMKSLKASLRGIKTIILLPNGLFACLLMMVLQLLVIFSA